MKLYGNDRPLIVSTYVIQ